MREQYTTVFVIREVVTGKLIKFGSKCGWATIGAAKNAFALHMHTTYRDYFTDGKGLFDSQKNSYKKYAIDKGAEPSKAAILKKITSECDQLVRDVDHSQWKIKMLNEKIQEMTC